MILGTEWIVDATGCDPSLLADERRLAAVFDSVIADLSLRVVGEVHWHKFPNTGGLSGVAMLTESHLACHTYPEFGSATFNLYCCRSRAPWPWEARLGELLCASQVRVRVVGRSSDSSEEAGAEFLATATTR